jgi:hypothetical protein
MYTVKISTVNENGNEKTLELKTENRSFARNTMLLCGENAVKCEVTRIKETPVKFAVKTAADTETKTNENAAKETAKRARKPRKQSAGNAAGASVKTDSDNPKQG